jgi:hypothetical protein
VSPYPEPAVLCRIRRCLKPARWIVTLTEHPNAGTSRDAYCGPHAESPGCLLWDAAPRPYTVTATGPFEPDALRAALGAAEVREHQAAKRQQIAELEAEQQRG